MTQFIRRPLVGLALGGGGARGFAHIGVLDALVAAGIPIDYLTGTSMGGVIATLFAAGYSPSQLAEEALKFTHSSVFLKLLDLAPPRRGLLSVQKVYAYLESLLGDRLTFDKLHYPLGLVTVDMNQLEEVTFTSGALMPALSSTVAVPGLFPAVKDGERCLVDGGILNNVPADLARKLGAELVIAVDVGNGNFRPDELQHGNNPWIRLLPRFAWDFYQAEMLMVDALSQYRLKEARPAVIIRPEIAPEITIFFGFPRAEEIIQAGRYAAEKAIPRLRSLLKPGLRWPKNMPPDQDEADLLQGNSQ